MRIGILIVFAVLTILVSTGCRNPLAPKTAESENDSMAWQTPKTDWSVTDAPKTTDVNRWEGNIEYVKDSFDSLRVGGPYALDITAQGDDIVLLSAAMINHRGLNVDYPTSLFTLSYSSYRTIHAINAAGRNPGSRITIVNLGSASHVFNYDSDNTLPDYGTYKPIKDRDVTGYALPPGASIEFILMGDWWQLLL